jgi:hypothetical protein
MKADQKWLTRPSLNVAGVPKNWSAMYQTSFGSHDSGYRSTVLEIANLYSFNFVEVISVDMELARIGARGKFDFSEALKRDWGTEIPSIEMDC